MEKLIETLKEWKREAEHSPANLKEPFAYQKVIVEVEARLAKQRILETSKEELNWEHYFDDLMRIWTTYAAVDAKTGRVTTCKLIKCENCLFKSMMSDGDEKDCIDFTEEWLVSPYKPIKKRRPKLTKEEYGFLKALKGGYIARDKDGDLWLFGLAEPFKLDEIWRPQEDDNIVELDDEKFEFIKWEDEEPWSIEELLKLEVEE